MTRYDQHTALILVDLQNDFLPAKTDVRDAGTLVVPDGDAVLPVALEWGARFELVIATQDWHPQNHESFASQHKDRSPGQLIDLHGLSQVLWPDHCVENTFGAEFAAEVRELTSRAHVFQKGKQRSVDSYSGFFDNGRRSSTGLSEFLKTRDVNRVFILGLATDYCVKFTALDAVAEGFETHLIESGCRGVNLEANDSERAIEAMREAGVTVV